MIRWPRAAANAGAAAAALGLLVGCRASDGGDAPRPPPDTSRPNYYEDVAPIFSKHCLSCHITGGVTAHVTLDSYAAASAPLTLPHLQHAVSAREMPPWGIDSTGRCGEFASPRGLSLEEQTTLLAWIDRGAPAGDPARRPPGPLPTALPPPDLADDARSYPLFADVQPTIADGAARCTIVDPGLTEPALVTGLAFEAARPFGVQQVTLHALDTDAAEAKARALDAADPASGWACVGATGVADARFVAGTTWTTSAVRLPGNGGIRIGAGKKLIVQVDYNLAVGLDAAGSVDVRIETAKLGDVREGVWRSVRADRIELSPMVQDALAEGRAVLPEAADVLAVYPSMRLLGTSLVLTADRPGGHGRTCMLNQDHWDLHLLRDVREYASPVHLDAQTLLSVQCRYTTLSQRDVVRGGEQPENEECGVLLYTPL